MIQLIFLRGILRFNRTMKTYLIPLDGSKTGESALPWAKFLSEGRETELRLLRCFHPLASVYSYPDFATPPPVPYDLSGFLRDSEKYLKFKAEEYNLDQVTVMVKEGDAASTILEQSEVATVDAVLMSSHGRGGLGRWLLGSVTTKIVRAAKKPVFVFRPENTDPKLDRILVCLDGSKLAEAALEPALELAQRFGSNLHLFRAVEYTPYPVADVQSALHEEVQKSQAYLQDVASRYPDLSITTEVRPVGIEEGILEAGAGCDLTVISSHGHGGFQRWLLGSVAEKVLHHAKTPILVVFGNE